MAKQSMVLGRKTKLSVSAFKKGEFHYNNHKHVLKEQSVTGKKISNTYVLLWLLRNRGTITM
jgi:hypothetical protein